MEDSLLVHRNRATKRKQNDTLESISKRPRNRMFLDECLNLGFEELGSFYQLIFRPNADVVVICKLWKYNVELVVRIIFRNTKEFIVIENMPLGKYPEKIERLQNLIMYLERMSNRKEDLFPELHDWSNFSKCNYVNFFFRQSYSPMNFIFESTVISNYASLRIKSANQTIFSLFLSTNSQLRVHWEVQNHQIHRICK